MRDLIVRTKLDQTMVDLPCKVDFLKHTLSNIYIGAWETVKCSQAGVHIDIVLSLGQNLDEIVRSPPDLPTRVLIQEQTIRPLACPFVQAILGQTHYLILCLVKCADCLNQHYWDYEYLPWAGPFFICRMFYLRGVDF